jgi:hypothetical protein
MSRTTNQKQADPIKFSPFFHKIIVATYPSKCGNKERGPLPQWFSKGSAISCLLKQEIKDKKKEISRSHALDVQEKITSRVCLVRARD